MAFCDFTLHRPDSVAEACRLGRDYGRDAAYMAGGTELLVDLRSGRKAVGHVIALGRLAELREIRCDGDTLHIGALATLNEIAESPEVLERFRPLAEAIETMAGSQIRNLATMGGNFSCGVPCSDTPPITCAAGGAIVLAGPDGEREVAARNFVLAPRKTVLAPGEIVTAIRIPPQPATSGANFQRFALRRGSALAVASVSAWLNVEHGVITEARIVMGAVGPVPLFAERCAMAVAGESPGETVFAAAGRIAAEEARPISDLRGNEQFRRDVVAVLARRALARAADLAEGRDR
ncbi:FAD binding domain-containing protein [bacterium]|nr:FAD binding domain-containing protein [bacterium]MBU1072021.1 FAD binding domain-containing protein [bacterium]MBU1676204.1 FAD binding domain-containing protein [bacterium]